MRAFLEKTLDEYFDENVYIANYGFDRLHIDRICFDGNDLEKTLFNKHKPTKHDVVMGSVEVCSAYIKHMGVDVPKYLGYPEKLKPYLKRDIIELAFGDINHPYPFFVKPSQNVKMFTGSLVESSSQKNILIDYYGVKPETMVYLSEPIEIVSEYRCFVHNRKLVGIQIYKGDFRKYIDVDLVDEMIDEYDDCPVAYTLDVGVDDKGDTILIEVNDMWAIGSYGLDPKLYCKMCLDRFREILN